MDTLSGKLVSQGAEAKIYLIDYLGEKAIVKERLQKKYRHIDLDKKITNERMIAESRNMAKARKVGVNTPYLMKVDIQNRKIYMQYVNGIKIRDFFYYLKENKEKLEQYKVIMEYVLQQIGIIIAKLHDSDIIHGDLTTSNMIIKTEEEVKAIIHKSDIIALYFIDFGLSYTRSNKEDRAVDLYVLEKAFISTHPELENEFQILLSAYEQSSKRGQETIAQLNQVRQRGRKKIAFG